MDQPAFGEKRVPRSAIVSLFLAVAYAALVQPGAEVESIDDLQSEWFFEAALTFCICSVERGFSARTAEGGNGDARRNPHDQLSFVNATIAYSADSAIVEVRPFGGGAAGGFHGSKRGEAENHEPRERSVGPSTDTDEGGRLHGTPQRAGLG